jgi:D-sedoheptulose 7-phosphate isomerase
MNLKKVFENSLSENIYIHQKLIDLLPEINLAIKIIFKKLKLGGKLLLCGNGGSAADAQHLVAEYLVRLRPKVDRKPLPAITLAQDTSTLTACGNDYLFDDIFLRPFQALAYKNDLLICLTTSGNSKNIIKVLKEAKKRKISTIGFLGNQGGKAKNFCDIKLTVNSKITARIQECHIFLGHFILERVESMIFSNIQIKDLKNNR